MAEIKEETLILLCGNCQCVSPQCGSNIEEDEGVMLLSCFHPFCRGCLSNIVKNTDAYQIQCPLADSTGSNEAEIKCGGYMSIKEIRAVVTEDEFQQYCERSGHYDISFLESLSLNTNSKSEDQNLSTVKFNTGQSNSTRNKPTTNGPLLSTTIMLSDNEDDSHLLEEPMDIQMSEENQLSIWYAKTETTCSFCCVKLKPQKGIIMQTCTHIFCKLCLKTCIENSNGSQIICLINDETQCGGFLLDREIKAIINKKSYENYIQKSENLAFNGISNIFQCTLDGCTAKCSVEDSKTVFLCPVCNSKNCLACKAIHDGIECDEYQQLLKEAISSRKNLKIFRRELSKTLVKNGFDQLAKKFSDWKAATGAGSTQNDFQNFLEAMNSKGIFLSDVEFECSICFDNVDVKQGTILQECLHCFCRICLIDVVKHSDTPEVKCPYQDCSCFLTPREIKALVPEDIYEKYLTRSVQQAESAMISFHCKTVDCSGWCEIDNEDQDGKFECYMCHKINCFRCKAIHGDISCEDYKNRLVQDENDIASQNALNQLVTSGQGMKCPTCKVVVQKTAGCDWLCCTLCKTEICWATKGPRWGPRGKGDTSGGCRCLLNGKRCTPNCGNCH